MAIAHSAESYVQEFAEEFDRWHRRIENLQRMTKAAVPQSRPEMEAGTRRIESLLGAAQDLLARSQPIGPEQWQEIHPSVTAALRAIQSCYNNLMADWPQL